MTARCAPVKCSLTAKAVLMWLAHHHNEETGRCDPSVELLASEGCMTTRTVGNALKELRAQGHISFENEAGKRHKFTLNPRTTFTPEGDSPPKEIPITPEGDSDRPPNIVPKPPKEIPINSKEQEGEQEKNRNAEFALDLDPPPKPIHLEFLETWNSHTELPSIREMSPKRIASLKQRMAGQTWRKEWKEAITRASRSSFCLGENKTGWRLTVDFFLQPDALTKIMEGKYDNQNGTKPPAKIIEAIDPTKIPAFDPERDLCPF